ncbi:MAG: hypothetical protein FJZ38_01890 [Candidatus Rokubacteria bacterium]|nr:hypothetical protein [Candidatus Rokubacteria bacterium]
MWSIVGMIAVKHSATAANAQPARNEDRDHERQAPDVERQPSERAEDDQHERDDRRVDGAEERGPQHLAPDHVAHLDLRGELALPRALVVHPDERGEERLEERRHERRVGEHAGRDEREIADLAPAPLDGAHVRAEPQPERGEHRDGLERGRQHLDGPVAEVQTHVTAHDRAALPLEGGREPRHEPTASLRKRSSSVGARTS